MKQIIAATVLAAAFSLTTCNVTAQTKPAKRFGIPVTFSKCGSTQQEALLRSKNPLRQGNEQFEQWLAPKVAAAKTQMLRKNASVVVTIPVVIHVIHNGDAVGVDENIADGQILSQIEVLNQDFRKRLGTMGFNNNPSGADTEIEFCLAQRDPAGVNTSGINRYNLGTGEGWEMEDMEALKPTIQWDPSKYLNIWLVDEIYTFGLQLAGYAQFPTNSGLDGIDGLGLATDAGTDGVVIAANCFGSEEIFPGGNYYFGKEWGRTATHEIGHFLGLRHIWGDEEDCVGNDFCADTPVAAGPNDGCPETGFDSCPAPGADMFKNYMDYTDDVCQNIFSTDQKARMMAVLANSPRRASLITANSCTPGTIHDLDGSLNMQGVNPQCASVFNPQVVLKNVGNTTLTSAAISYQLDNQAPAIYNWTGSLAYNQQATIQLPTTNAAAGEHSFNVSIASLNNGTDMEPANDDRSITFNIVSSFNTTKVVIKIQNDNGSMETLWVLTDENEEFIATNLNIDDIFASDFPAPNSFTSVTVNVDNNTCYMFGIADFGANGLCCSNGNGYYRIETLEGAVIAEGSQFTSEASHMFRIGQTMGVENTAFGLNTIKLYPNPAADVLNIAIPEGVLLPDAYTLYNSLGQIVGSGKFTSAQQQVNISGFSKGAYFIKINAGSQVRTMQFIKY
jgi:hypothetical protein